MEWCNDGEILAVGGFVRQPNLDCSNQLRFYTRDGSLRYSLDIPQQPKPLTALTWGHNNRRLFVAAGCHVYTLWVTKMVAPLQYLCRRSIQQTLPEETAVQKLPLPSKLKHSVTALFSNTVKGYIPDALKLREFVCVPPPTQERLHCTMIRHGEETSGGHYTLYLEYLGGLVPLLKGKRASKIRPEFVVFDPKIKTSCKAADAGSFERGDPFVSSDSSSSSWSGEDDAVGEGCGGSPRVQRRKRRRKRRGGGGGARAERRDSSASNRPLDDLLYDDNLPESAKLLEVTSNIWGTKFKLHGVASFLPEDMGHVLYKTSLLHLQPRQMTVSIAELTNDLRPLERDPTYNPNVFSESDDEGPVTNGVQEYCQDTRRVPTHEVPISPDLHLPPPPRLTDGQGLHPPPPPPPPPHPYQDPAPPLDTGAPLEVPVIIESRLPVFQAKGEKSSCSPFEIRSLDGSPPQRRSPSVKSCSLTPADPLPFTGSALVETSLVDGDISLGFSKDMFIEKGAIPKVKSNSTQLNQVHASNGFSNGSTQLDTCDSDTDLLGVSGSQNHLVQLAAKKLEDVIHLHQCRQDGSLILESGSSQQNCDKCDSKTGGEETGDSPSRPCGPSEIKYIDDEVEDPGESCSDSGDAVFSSSDPISARDLMKSEQILADTDSQSGQLSADSSALLSTPTHVARDNTSTHNRRLILATHPTPKHSKSRRFRSLNCRSTSESVDSLQDILDQSYYISTKQDNNNSQKNSRCNSPSTTFSNPNSPVLGDRRALNVRRGSLELIRLTCKQDCSVSGSASLPTSPVRKIVKPQTKKAHSKQDISLTKHKSQSPLTKRRSRHQRHLTDCSSDEEIIVTGDVLTGENYKNLETFQKAQLNKKLRKVRTKSLGDGDALRGGAACSPSLRRRRHFVMHNKAPLWNENSQVYQLDFGGRVTQESAKNFQIEFRGKQVMQFGRIDGNAYTLDFQYPFSAVQAFAVALANVTQRLK